jgi:predicted amidohydrolase
VQINVKKGVRMNLYKLCGLQIETGSEPEKNKEKILDLFKEAAKTQPDFIVFPEMFEIVAKPQDAVNHTHSVPSEFTDTFSGLAKAYSVNIVCGSFFEHADGGVYNTTVVFNRKGELCGKYRKMHLFDAFGYGESTGLEKGQKPVVLELDGLKFGLAICYDVRFPEIFRYYALQGAKVVFLPSAFFQPNHDHWFLNLRSRALDNTIFVMSCNQTGNRFVGRSMVANPWGITIASMGVEEGFYTAEIDVDYIEEVRKKRPFLENRRFDVLSMREQ